MKISILSPDTSHNCLFREYTLARLLSKNHTVDIIGPHYGPTIWPPLKDIRDVSIKSIRGDHTTGKFNWKLLLKLIDGDIIYAHKPYIQSFGLGLLARLTKHKPLLLDLDDYEPAFYKNAEDEIRWYDKLLHKSTCLADGITVTNSKLQGIYGGTIVPNAVDTNLLIPSLYTNKAPVIGYIGTTRPHKGLYELVKALILLRHRDYVCIITASGDAEYMHWVNDLIAKTHMENKIKIIEQQSYHNLNNVLSTIDIVVIPQQNTLASHYQVPVKLLDAMATGKTIITSDLEVIREVAGDCVMYVKPSDLFGLTIAIDGALCSHPNGAYGDELGKEARERCVKLYDLKVVRRKLNKVIKELA